MVRNSTTQISAGIEARSLHGREDITRQIARSNFGTEVGSSAFEALCEAGLNWTVERRLLSFDGGLVDSRIGSDLDGPRHPRQLVPGLVGNVRSDTGELLGVVGPRYEIFHNYELLHLAQAVEEESGAVIEMVGSHRGGRDVYFLMKNSSFMLPGEDAVHIYHYFGNNHTGERSLWAIPTSIRPLCENVLGMISDGASGLRIAHTRSMRDRVTAAVAAIDHSKDQAKIFQAQCERLAAERQSAAQIQEYFEEVYEAQYGSPVMAPAETLTRGEKSRQTRRGATLTAWHENLEREGERGLGDLSRWSALNAVTEWSDHQKPTRGDRAYANFQGASSKFKRRAFSLALGNL